MSRDLTPAELKRMSKLHPDLIQVFRQFAATTTSDFQIIQCDRSPEQQAINLAKGVSMTKRSRHVVKNNKNGYACAIDAAPRLEGNIIPWKRWDLFAKMNKEMMAAAAKVKIPIEWGGNWKRPVDGDHWQLPWKNYP